MEINGSFTPNVLQTDITSNKRSPSSVPWPLLFLTKSPTTQYKQSNGISCSVLWGHFDPSKAPLGSHPSSQPQTEVVQTPLEQSWWKRCSWRRMTPRRPQEARASLGPRRPICSWISVADFQLVRGTFFQPLCRQESLGHGSWTGLPGRLAESPGTSGSPGGWRRNSFPLLSQGVQLACISEPKMDN